MKKKKITDIPVKASSGYEKTMGIEVNALAFYEINIPTIRGTGRIKLNTGKSASTRGGFQLFRVSIYNHTSMPNLIMISIWTHTTIGGISSSGSVKLNNNANDVTIYEGSDGNIWVNIEALAYSQIIIEDLSSTKYQMTIVV